MNNEYRFNPGGNLFSLGDKSEKWKEIYVENLHADTIEGIDDNAIKDLAKEVCLEKDGTAQKAIADKDGNIIADTYALKSDLDKITTNITMSGNGLVPEESGTVSLGSEDKKYKEVHANKIIVDEIVGSDGKPIEMGGGNTYIINNLGYASRNHYYKKGEIIAYQASETKVVYLTCKV